MTPARFGRKRNRGVAAIEMMVVVVLLLAAATVAVPVFLQRVPVDRQGVTAARLAAIKLAICGDPGRLAGRARTWFGFVGDLGVLPASLDELVANSANRPGYAADPGGRPLYFGWRGPYLGTAQVGGSPVALLDGWGNAIAYGAGASPVSRELRSAGADGTLNTADDQVLAIYENEVSGYVGGDFWTDRRKTAHFSESQVTVWFPDGTPTLRANAISTAAPHQHYSSQSDTVSDTSWRRFPLGVRYFETLDQSLRKLASLNGGGAASGDTATVDFFAAAGAETAPSFELTFDGSDNPADNPRTDRSGRWQLDGNGNLVAITNGENRTFFGDLGQPLWQDYRVEVNATLVQGRGYGVYYRSNGQANVSGYCFQYDPGLNAAGIALVVRRVFNGSEQAPFQQLTLSSAQFSARFGSAIYNDSHQVSITVQGSAHIIKLDGQVVLSFSDAAFPSGNPGLRSWDGRSYTRFHHVRAHGIPPLAGGEIAWWSFEEGNRNVAYGSGFLVGAAENNGALNGATRVSGGRFGQAASFSGRNGVNVTVPHLANLNPAAQIAIEAWVYTGNDNNRADIVTKGGVGAGHGFFQGPGQGAQSGWNAYLQTGAGSQSLNWNGGRPQENRWYHLVLTHDGATLRFYVDAVQRATAARAGPPVPNASDLVIGNAFDGRIDEVRLYNRALSFAEVLLRYQHY